MVKQQKNLPGMEDTKITEIENLALKYAEVRDQRMAALKGEVEFKQKLLVGMKRATKQPYRRHNVEVRIVHEEETVKVKVKENEDE